MDNRLTQTSSFTDGVRACLPTIMGYLGIGIAMGIVGKSAHLAIWQIFLMSTLVYAGSAQFILCGLLLLSAPILSIVFTVFLVNLRHLLMSLSVAHYFKDDSLLNGMAIGTLLTDESYGVLMTTLAQEKKVSSNWMHGLNITAYLVWILSTVIGALLGNFIPDPTIFGFDFALTSMFLGLFLFQVQLPLKKQRAKTVRILAVTIITLYLLMRIVSAELSVILATLLGCLTGVMSKDE
ncbi:MULTISPECIES: AzlC family ABC transporter permease [Enterococcus]|jgi:4-azaleucine resistance transporter AzlC|uniref:AzlC family ABC transporter permease n=1 Tax=Enterococcus raffinosus TaxID=71452 RepID=A0AAW8T4Q3_9ENTE|nr:AzlC family ABC transporter permease [Enterococcus raffinosus]MDT2523545.1 AzlC family ABC transporter permease [Enterococcus raffinosus]MDT2529031.1 AzlC family ABC transporter permease [Enterococcus raffinosus]MDT2532278.1 AzlC family ABC transporter permease [Enterococcus raffinosus]MDT2544090.1 AzlC family ABC transporter permease [Enterococcus raffinosus]MDT2555430.1 AzlC family ABC transporter permease [Enterococcus raffinosus]